MKSILISNPVWGKLNCNNFCNYSLKSLLYKGNIPLLIYKYNVTLHILTKKDDLEYFEKNEYFKNIPKSVKIKFFFFTDNFFFSGKYSKVTKLQNISIKESKSFDYLIFNYADFVWANNSLKNLMKEITKSKVNFLSFFCLPVDHNKLKRFVRSKSSISQKQLSKFSAENLHREAKLRFWDDETFTLTPTFIIFSLKSNGLLVSAYHQTILVAAVKEDNQRLLKGIKGITLDEYFSSILDKENYQTIQSSKDVMVSAICDWKHSSAIPLRWTREKSLKSCFKRLNKSNRELSEKIIFFESKPIQKNDLRKKLNESSSVIKSTNNKYGFNVILHYFLTHPVLGPYVQILYKLFEMFFFLRFIWYKIFYILKTVIFELISIYANVINLVIYYIFFQNSKKKFKKPNFRKIFKSYQRVYSNIFKKKKYSK